MFFSRLKKIIYLKRHKENSIPRLSMMRSRLVIVFSLLFISAFSIVSLVSYRISKSFILRDTDIVVQEVLNAYAAEVDQWLWRIISVVSAYSQLVESGIPDDSMITSELLSNFRKEAFFSDIYYADTHGRFISGRGWIPPKGYDPRLRPWYISVKNSRDTIISKPYYDYETGTLAISVSRSMWRRDGRLRGVLSADILLSTVGEKFLNMNIRGKGFAAIIDKDGVVLVHKDKDLVGRNLFDIPGYRKTAALVLGLRSGRVEYGETEKKEVLFTSIPSAEWIMGLVLNRNELYSDLVVLSWKFNIIFAVSMILVISVAVYFSRRLTAFAEMLETAVDSRTAELREKVAEVEYLSLTDPLTGIFNRRKIEAVLDDEIARSERSGLPLSVISMDLDNFKKINDTLGHEAGDTALKRTANVIASGIRAVDISGRMGGEEFIVVCPDTPGEGVFKLAGKLRALIESIELEGHGRITSSFGCATRMPGEDTDSFLARADKALYRAKGLGRNRVERAEKF